MLVGRALEPGHEADVLRIDEDARSPSSGICGGIPPGTRRLDADELPALVRLGAARLLR